MKVSITTNEGVLIDTISYKEIQKEWDIDGENIKVSAQDFAEVVKDAVLEATKFSDVTL